MPRTWNNGMVEYWNVDTKGKILFYQLRCQEEFCRYPNIPFAQNPLFQHSSIPVFQYSSCERSELSSLAGVS